MNQKHQSSNPVMSIIYLVALLSGVSGLTYEVVWTRMLIIPLGNSSDATALVLASFMLGIAIGARMFGKTADRVQSPLRLYAVLEILLGIYAVAMPLLIDMVLGIEALTGSFDQRPTAAVGRFIAAGSLVVLPSLIMGATVPIIIRALSSRHGGADRRVGLVYGVNTIGAAVGAALTGFIFIPKYGMALTSVIAACGSFVAAIIALIIHRFTSGVLENADSEDSDNTGLPGRKIAVAALIVAVTSGFTMLAAEVIWNRILTFVFGHDTYAFAILLVVVLTGLGIGGFIHRRLADKDPILVTGTLIGFLAAALLGAYWCATALVVEYGRDPFGIGEVDGLVGSLWLEFYRELLYAGVLVLVPTVIAGAAFPAACALYIGSVKRAGGRVGTAALVNGIGAALGSLVASFLLIGWVGIQGAFIMVAMIAAVVSVLFIFLSGKLSSIPSVSIMTIGPLLTLLIGFLIPANMPPEMLQEAVGERHQNLMYYEEARNGTVSVTSNEINAEKQLFMNAVNEVTTRLVHDQSFKLLGHLGPLLHPRPRNGAMVCFGAGLSAGAALVHPFTKLDVAELSAAIPRAAQLWEKENNSVLNDPRFNLRIADGRHFLLSSRERYDVIMVDSTHPKAVDSWILYTKEFYEIVRERLNADGIAVQWVPLHGLSEREFKIIVSTFLAAFPEATMWVNVGFETYGQAAYVKLVGRSEPLLIDYSELERRLREPRIARDLKPFGMDDPIELLDLFLAGPDALKTWTAGLPHQTDNRPIVPYTTEYSRGRRMAAPLLLGIQSSVFPLLRRMGERETKIREELDLAREAEGFLLAGMLPEAMEAWPSGKKIKLFERRLAQGRGYYLELAKRYFDDPQKLFEIASYLGNLGHLEDAKRLYEEALQITPDDFRISINLALVLLDLKESEQSLEMLSQIVKQQPENGLALYNCGVALVISGDLDAAISMLKRAIAISPDLTGARLKLAEAQFQRGNLDSAEAGLRDVVARNRWIAHAWDMLGLIAAARDDWAEAKNHHIRALGLEPYRANTLYNLGIALQETGQLKKAAASYQAALKIEPRDAEAYNNLGLIYTAVGLFDKAAEAHRKALELEPNYPEAAFNLGLDYRALGNRLDAAKMFGLALELAPGLVQAQKQLAELGIENVEIRIEPSNPNDAGPDAAM